MKVLVTGASGQLGGYLLRALGDSGHQISAWSGSRRGRYEEIEFVPVDFRDLRQLDEAFLGIRPDCVIHAAAISQVAECYQNPELAAQINSVATARLSELASDHRCRLIYVSTDMVFDGTKGNYSETDVPAPLSIYGRSKAEGEKAVLSRTDQCVVRVSLLFGENLYGGKGFFGQMAGAIRENQPFQLFKDEWRTPLSLHRAALGLVRTAESDATGLFHLGGPERLSRYEMGCRLAAHLGKSKENLVPIQQSSLKVAEPRAPDLSFDSTLWSNSFPDFAFPNWEESLSEMGWN